MSVTASPPPVSTNQLVTTTAANLNSLIIWVIIGVIGLVMFMILMIYVVQDKLRTPKPSKNITKAHRKHIPLILLSGLDYIADLYPLRDFIPEVLESFPFGKGAKKRTYRYVLPQEASLDDIRVAEGKSAEFTAKVIKSLNDLNTSQVHLRGTNSPVFVGVKNRAIAASMPFLGALNWVKDLEMIAAQTDTIEAMKKSKLSQVRDLGGLLSRMATGVSSCDFSAVYKYVDVNWDHTIQDSISERDKTDGRLEGKEDKDKQTKTVLLLILGIAAFLAIGIIAAKVL